MRFAGRVLFSISLAFPATYASAQAAPAAPAATGAPRATGTVKATAPGSITVTAASGDVVVNVGDSAKVLVVPPGSKDLKAATPGALSDIAAGDRVLVTGTAGDPATPLNATRLIVMKAAAIADAHAADEAAWAAGVGGIVKSVDTSAGTILLSSGMKTITVSVTPKTIFRHYSDGSVRFQDATASTFTAVQKGDQLRVRGTKSADGGSIAADEVVAGSFRNFSGLISSIDPAGSTVTLKDLTTKQTVTVAISQGSDVHRLPPMVAAAIAARMKGGAAGGGAGAPAGGMRPGGPGGTAEGGRGPGSAGHDLSSMISRLPTETLSGLKVGDAVMIVATAPSGSGHPTAVTLLAGVDPILTAPAGQSMTLSPWSLGGGGGEEAGGGGGGGSR